MASEPFSKLNWLKRTDGHKFTGAEFRVLVSIFNHADGKTGRKAHPGVDLMTEETTYRKSGVSEAVAALKARGWIHETYRGNGKARLSSEFDLVPDAPNPGYRCPEDRAGKCSTCSNGSAVAEVLEQPNGSAQAGVLGSNDSGFRSNGSAVAGPIHPLGRLPIDPGSDPKIRSSWSGPEGPPSDPHELRYPPEQGAFQSRPLQGLSELPEDKTAELSPRDYEPQSESERAWESVSLFGTPDPAPTEHLTRWPAGKPLPNPRDQFTTYIDETTGEPIPV